MRSIKADDWVGYATGGMVTVVIVAIVNLI